MDEWKKETEVHTYDGILFSLKKKEILSLEITHMKHLEDMVLK
jgi:hypothetical protein